MKDMDYRWIIGMRPQGYSELGLADVVDGRLMFLDKEHSENPRELGEFQEVKYFRTAKDAIKEFCFRYDLDKDEGLLNAKISRDFPITYTFENDPIKRFFLHDRYMKVHGAPKLVTTSPEGAGYHTAKWNWDSGDARRWILEQEAPKKRFFGLFSR